MSHPLVIPPAALAQHAIVLGKTRSGKSSKMRYLVEYMLAKREPVCIIDPKGDWWGIKSSADGKKAGYPVVIFGGEHGDVPLAPGSGSAIAELITAGNRPALIDLGGWMVGDRTRWYIDFASTFFRLARGQRPLVIDEVHNFAPQGRIMDPDAGKMLHWSNRLASEGAGKGIILLAASQRPQKVHKDFVTSCETLVACRVVHKLDRDAIKDWIDGCADPAAGKTVLAELAGMERSDAWVWSPEIDYGPKRVRFPLFSTYDSFKPQAGGAPVQLKGWADVDLDDVRTKLAASIEAQAANDPKALRARIAALESAARKPREMVMDQQLLDRAQKEAWADGQASGIQLANEAHSRRIQALGESLHGAIGAQIGHAIAPLVVPASARVPRPGAPLAIPAGLVRRQAAPERTAMQDFRAQGGKAKPAQAAQDGAGALTRRAERQVLAALAQYQGGRSKRQIAVLAGYAGNGGGFNNALARLRSLGFIQGSQDLMTITMAGLGALGSFDPLPTGKALLDHWMSQLSRKAEREALQGIVAAYPGAIAKDQLAEVAGYQPNGGGFNNALARLRTLDLIASSGGGLRASDDLF